MLYSQSICRYTDSPSHRQQKLVFLFLKYQLKMNFIVYFANILHFYHWHGIAYLQQSWHDFLQLLCILGSLHDPWLEIEFTRSLQYVVPHWSEHSMDANVNSRPFNKEVDLDQKKTMSFPHIIHVVFIVRDSQRQSYVLYPKLGWLHLD